MIFDMRLYMSNVVGGVVPSLAAPPPPFVVDTGCWPTFDGAPAAELAATVGCPRLILFDGDRSTLIRFSSKYTVRRVPAPPKCTELATSVVVSGVSFPSGCCATFSTGRLVGVDVLLLLDRVCILLRTAPPLISDASASFRSDAGFFCRLCRQFECRLSGRDSEKEIGSSKLLSESFPPDSEPKFWDNVSRGSSIQERRFCYKICIRLK